MLLIFKQSRNKTRKSSVKRLILLVGSLFLGGVIWGLVSLHVWILVFFGIAVFYVTAHLKKNRHLIPEVTVSALLNTAPV